MRTKKEVYNLISDLNEEAFSRAWDTWEESDRLMDSYNEDDWTRAEEVKEQASEEQARYFREMLGRHPDQGSRTNLQTYKCYFTNFEIRFSN